MLEEKIRISLVSGWRTRGGYLPIVESTSQSLRGFRGSFFGVALLLRQRVGAQLNVVDLRAVRGATLVVEDGARARHRPHTFAFPTRLRVIHPGIQELGEKARGIWHTHL